MPELPEVETSVKGIAPFCVEQLVVKLVVRQPKLRWPVDPKLPQKVQQQRISKVARRGKYILIELDTGAIMIHLGMSGSLRVIEAQDEPSKHDHVDIVLSSGKAIRYNDPRRFGSVIYNQQGESHPLLEKLGVEPLTDAFNQDYLIDVCKKRKVAIKPLIMNSQVVVGVGNIYAQEALFRAGIHPLRSADKIAAKRLTALVETIKAVLQEAIESGGSSLKDFTAADGKPGYFQHHFDVYGKAGTPCPKCHRTLKQQVIAQRSTVYCGHCQR